MFTGIVEEIGVTGSANDDTLRISVRRVQAGLKLGDSVAVNGVCLTVSHVSGSDLIVDIMPETLRRSNLGALGKGARVNVERALSLGSRLGGHLVQGHVDATGRITALTPEGHALIMAVSAPTQIARYLVEKAFIAIDGVSLTIAACEHQLLKVSLVGFTLHNTTFSEKKIGDSVNLEVDIIAKYIEHFSGSKNSGLTMAMLNDHGFGCIGQAEND
jgi:riboflavin synthase